MSIGCMGIELELTFQVHKTGVLASCRNPKYNTPSVEKSTRIIYVMEGVCENVRFNKRVFMHFNMLSTPF